MQPLRDYQLETVKFIAANPRCAVTSAAGTGKTRCCIESWVDTDRVLIICPAHLRETWEREIKKWRPYFLPMVTIKSYDYFARLKSKVTLPVYTRCVVDESTYLKSWTAKRTQIICILVLPKIKNVTFLSASPIQKSAMDIHPALTVIDPNTVTESQFEERYCNRTYDHFRGIIFTGVNTAHANELKDLWGKTCIKFTKAMVAKELPPIVEDITYVHSAHRPDYDPATLDYEHVTAEMKTEYQVVGMEKVPYVIDFVDTSPNEPTLVFCHHRRVNEELTAALKKLGKRVGQILGGDSKKDEKVVAFQNGEIDYLVISMEAGGTGLNLPRASRVLFAELPWTYVTYYQCMNRAHRLNTEHTVYVHTFVLSATLDEGLLRTIEEKKGYSDAIIGEIDNTIKEKDHAPKKTTRTKTSAEPDPHTRNQCNSSGEGSTSKDDGKRTPRKRTGRDSGGASGNGISEPRPGTPGGWSSNGRSPVSADVLGLGLDDLGLGISAFKDRLYVSNTTTKHTYSNPSQEPLGQGSRNPSAQCSDFLDELCRPTVSK